MLFKILILSLFSFGLMAQESKAPVSNVKGKIVDYKTQQVLIGVTIQLLGTKFGALTDKKENLL